jgi:hypothetical protein
MTITIDGKDSVWGNYSAYMEVGESGYYAALANVEIEGERINFVAVGEIPIQLDADFIPKAIAVNGINFVPAGNPQEPVAGEYIYNPYNQTVTVYGNGNVVMIGERESVPVYPPLLRSPHPWLLTSFPLEGQISINRSFEQHPSASFEFETSVGKSFLQAALNPGLEVDIYGIPLRINSLPSIKELPRAIYPDGRVRVSISFGGRWENYVNDPCFLRGDGRNSFGNETPFADPDCQVGQGNSSINKSSTTVPTLLKKIKIPYIGPGLIEVQIPPDTPLDATINPVSALQERVRIANGFVFWSNPEGAEVKVVGSQSNWVYSEKDILGEIDTSYDAIDRPSKRKLISVEGFNPPEPDLINFPNSPIPFPIPILRGERPTALAYEYPNSELSGEFSQPKDKNEEKTQGQSKPRYAKKEPQRTTRIEGDKNADVPLEGVNYVQNMSLCFDIGGQTKTRTFVNEENGTRVQEINEIWGFAYTAISIYDSGSKRLKGTVSETWKLLKKTTTNYVYDTNTGYLLYIIEDGFNTVRYKQESNDDPETLKLKSDSDELPLYAFIQIPVTSRTSYRLKLMPNWSSEGLFETFKRCNRDGTSSTEIIFNPNYAPPYYVEIERSESLSFNSRPNPKNKNITTTSTTKRKPDLTAGEESRFQSIIDITPAKYQIFLTGEVVSGFAVQRQGAELQPQKFIKYIRKFKAQGQSIAEALEEVSVEEGTGDPPTAQRRADLFAREEDNQDNKLNSNDTSDKLYRYFVQTAGYSFADPIGGSESFSAAQTLGQALTAARCKLAIENWRAGLTENLQIPGNLGIKEGDRFNYFCNGEYRQRVVLSVNHNISILGVIGNQPQITIITSLTLGRWIFPPLTWNQVLIPDSNPRPQDENLLVINPVLEKLGSLLDWNGTRSRRNP